MNRFLIAAGVSAAVLFTTTAANAQLVFANAAGNFSSSTGTNGIESFADLDALAGNEVFRYGNEASAGLGPNILSFGSAAGPVTLTQGAEFTLGTLSYHNSSTTGQNEIVTVDLGITPSLTFNGSSVSAMSSYRFTIDNTPNAPPCPFPGGDFCADQVMITALSGGVTTFDIGGQTLRLFVDGFLDSSGHLQSTFIGSENTTTTATLVGRFDLTTNTTPGAPEPASWALMLVGFGGLGAMLRRRHARRAAASA
jgi:hypothetical protein